jgi:hypothetical protein
MTRAGADTTSTRARPAARRAPWEGLAAGPCLLLAWSLAPLGCDPGTTECACHPTGLLLEICPELADQVVDGGIELTGSACASVTPTLLEGGAEGGYTAYDIQPHQAGQCSIQVSFTNGLTFTANAGPNPITFNHGPGCCSGLYPDPLSAAQTQVCPLTDAAADSETVRDSTTGS